LDAAVLSALSAKLEDTLRGVERLRTAKRFEVLVGAAVLANNLLHIAEMLRNGKPARAKKAA
jgi:hypothetical protein